MPLSCVVVLPACNEGHGITRVVAEWNGQMQLLFGDNYRIIVIDDGSRDATGAILDGIARKDSRVMVHHQPNRGHGGAIMEGYRRALAIDAQYVFQTDSDGQMEAADFAALWQRRQESGCILAHRRTRRDPLHRMMLSAIASVLVSGLFGVRLKDSNVPYRLMTRAFLQQALPLVPRGAFAPNICLAVIAARRGLPLLHIPVAHRKRASGRPMALRVVVAGSVRSLCDLLRLRLAGA